MSGDIEVGSLWLDKVNSVVFEVIDNHPTTVIFESTLTRQRHVYLKSNINNIFSRVYMVNEIRKSANSAYNEGFQEGANSASSLEASAYNNGLNHELIERLEDLNCVDDNVYEYLKSDEFFEGFEEYKAKSKAGLDWGGCEFVGFDDYMDYINSLKKLKVMVKKENQELKTVLESLKEGSKLDESMDNAYEQGFNSGYEKGTADAFEAAEILETQKDEDCNNYSQLKDELGLVEKYPHYYKDVRHLNVVDVYQVCQLFPVKDDSGAINHARKKLLVCGGRGGGKDMTKDIKEAYDTLGRWLNMQEENKRGE